MKQNTDKLRGNGLFYKHLPTTLLKYITKDIMHRLLTTDELCTLSLIFYAGKNGVKIREIYYHFNDDKDYATEVIRELVYHGICEVYYDDEETIKMRKNFMLWGFGIIDEEESQKLYFDWHCMFEYCIDCPINDFKDGKTFEIPKQTGEILPVRKSRKNRTNA